MQAQNKKVNGLFLGLILVLLLLVGLCLWQFYHEAKHQKALREQEEALLVKRLQDLEARRDFLKLLLSLPPCEAEERWQRR
ncbi:MAG: hypothetical protein IJS50_03335 [Desulfovibrio sp.]|nr:hypothetical protein [Desulfovibrio sp.]